MRRACCLIAALMLAVALALAARAPMALQKISSLTDAPSPPLDAHAAVDIASIVRAIPDRGTEGSDDTVYEVLPARRYERSVIQGLGNCSNLVKGLSWKLIRDGQPFEIVYLLPMETFLEGQGHTLLRTPIVLPEGEQIALIDVAAAAIPRSGARALDVTDLAGAVPDIRLDPIRTESEDWTRFYKSEFLSQATIGRTESADTARWYRFLEAIYLDLGLPEKIEKTVYVGIGIVLGVFPPIHVDNVEVLRSRHRYEFGEMKAVLWVLRGAPLILLGCWLSWLVERSVPARHRHSFLPPDRSRH